MEIAMIKEVGFVTPVFLAGLVGRPITTWGGAATATDRGVRLIVPLSAVDTCVPWHNVAWWTEAPARIDVTEQAKTSPEEDAGPSRVAIMAGPGEIELTMTQHATGGGAPYVTPAPGRGKKR